MNVIKADFNKETKLDAEGALTNARRLGYGFDCAIDTEKAKNEYLRYLKLASKRCPMSDDSIEMHMSFFVRGIKEYHNNA